MKSRGQGALEYLSTYGWAILVALVVGIALMDLGVFNIAESRPSSFSGFPTLRPVDFKCESSSGDVHLSIVNTAGGDIHNISVGGVPCDPESLAPGKTAICVAQSAEGCVDAAMGESYSSTVRVDYVSPVGIEKASAGEVWGVAQ